MVDPYVAWKPLEGCRCGPAGGPWDDQSARLRGPSSQPERRLYRRHLRYDGVEGPGTGRTYIERLSAP